MYNIGKKNKFNNPLSLKKIVKRISKPYWFESGNKFKTHLLNLIKFTLLFGSGSGNVMLLS